MEIREVKEKPREWNRLAGHPLQAWEWGEFRARTGVRVVRYGVYDKDKLVQVVQTTIHPIPYTPWTIGYYPKGNKPTKQLINILNMVVKKYNCIYIKCEPLAEASAVTRDTYTRWHEWGLVRGRSLFTPHNFVLDVTPTEDQLLAACKQKTRYNIRLAERRGVKVAVDNSAEAFARYLQLTEETTKRQKFYSHAEDYHRKMGEVLGRHADTQTRERDRLQAELLVARYKNQIITTWVLFTLNDTLYYPYGASTREHRELMANNLVMWEAIRLAKSKGCKYLDMWGALPPEPDKSDPWYGFHKFKEGYGGRHVTYVGSWDYVARPLLYYPLRAVEWVRWKILRLVK